MEIRAVGEASDKEFETIFEQMVLKIRTAIEKSDLNNMEETLGKELQNTKGVTEKNIQTSIIANGMLYTTGSGMKIVRANKEVVSLQTTTDCHKPQVGDRLIIANEGFWKAMHDDAELADLIAKERDAQRAAEILKEAAIKAAAAKQNTSGEPISVIVFPLPPPAPQAR